MVKEHGTMDFDWRKRCALLVEATSEMPEHRVIYYGLTSRELGRWDAVDLPGYVGKSSRGRRSGQAQAHSRHFFNKRIMTDDERIGGAAVQASRDEDRIRARYGVGGASRTEQVEAAAGSTGGGDSSTKVEEEKCPGHVASPDNPKVCDRCGVHIDSLRPDEATA